MFYCFYAVGFVAFEFFIFILVYIHDVQIHKSILTFFELASHLGALDVAFLALTGWIIFQISKSTSKHVSFQVTKEKIRFDLRSEV